MAVVTTKSTIIQDAEASPQVRELVTAIGGKLRSASATAEVAAADDDGSIYAMVKLPSNAAIKAITVYNDAIAAGTDYDIGLYKWTNGAVGAEQDKDLFADGISMASARLTGSFNALYNTLDFASYIGKRIWKMLGLTTDPNVDYVVAFTANTVGTAAGSLGVDVFYTLE